jgi:hypothetical protein
LIDGEVTRSRAVHVQGVAAHVDGAARQRAPADEGEIGAGHERQRGAGQAEAVPQRERRVGDHFPALEFGQEDAHVVEPARPHAEVVHAGAVELNRAVAHHTVVLEIAGEVDPEAVGGVRDHALVDEPARDDDLTASREPGGEETVHHGEPAREVGGARDVDLAVEHGGIQGRNLQVGPALRVQVVAVHAQFAADAPVGHRERAARRHEQATAGRPCHRFGERRVDEQVA